MHEHVRQTIELVQQEIRKEEEKTAQKKRMVNGLCEMIGDPPIYADPEPSQDAVPCGATDEFYGQPMAKVVRLILERRKRAGSGAASVNEIFDAMVAGGFHFNTKNEDNAKRGLYTSLGKNTKTFHRLPNGRYGLLEWYPNAKVKSAKNGDGATDEARGDEASDDSPSSDDLDLLSGVDEGEPETAGAPTKPR